MPLGKLKKKPGQGGLNRYEFGHILCRVVRLTIRLLQLNRMEEAAKLSLEQQAELREMELSRLKDEINRKTQKVASRSDSSFLCDFYPLLIGRA